MSKRTTKDDKGRTLIVTTETTGPRRKRTTTKDDKGNTLIITTETTGPWLKRTETKDDKGRTLIVTTEATGPWPHPYVTRVRLISASGYFVNGFVHANYLSERDAFEGHHAYVDRSYDGTIAVMNQLEKTWTV